MIVDTSALAAILLREPGHETLLAAIAAQGGQLPAPARVEFLRVASGNRVDLAGPAEQLLNQLERLGLDTIAFTAEHASLAAAANARHGKGMGGPLNLLDLMVLAVAQAREQPILCTGNDFRATGAAIHPASRAG